MTQILLNDRAKEYIEKKKALGIEIRIKRQSSCGCAPGMLSAEAVLLKEEKELERLEEIAEEEGIRIFASKSILPYITEAERIEIQGYKVLGFYVLGVSGVRLV